MEDEIDDFEPRVSNSSILATTDDFVRRVSSCSLLRVFPLERDSSIWDMRLSFFRKARRRLLIKTRTGPQLVISVEEDATIAAIVVSVEGGDYHCFFTPLQVICNKAQGTTSYQSQEDRGNYIYVGKTGVVEELHQDLSWLHMAFVQLCYPFVIYPFRNIRYTLSKSTRNETFFVRTAKG